VFRFRPLTVYVGAAVSAASLVAVAALVWALDRQRVR
jgi:hypothetical protein